MSRPRQITGLVTQKIYNEYTSRVECQSIPNGSCSYLVPIPALISTLYSKFYSLKWKKTNPGKQDYFSAVLVYSANVLRDLENSYNRGHHKKPLTFGSSKTQLLQESISLRDKPIFINRTEAVSLFMNKHVSNKTRAQCLLTSAANLVKLTLKHQQEATPI